MPLRRRPSADPATDAGGAPSRRQRRAEARFADGIERGVALEACLIRAANLAAKAYGPAQLIISRPLFGGPVTVLVEQAGSYSDVAVSCPSLARFIRLTAEELLGPGEVRAVEPLPLPV